MINQMYSRIELRFWDWAIPVLSHSCRVKQFIRQLQPFTNQLVLKKFAFQSIIIGLAGFAGGLIISTLIR
jgi:predicted CDP-diglyceride synthetase/phosphatidate cytidylyltransferase